jgi:hypothetical protein
MFEDEFWDKTVNDYKRQLISEFDSYKEVCSEITGEWLDLLKKNSARKEIKIKMILHLVKFTNK